MMPHVPLQSESGPAFRWTWRDASLVAGATLLSHVYTGIEYGLRAHSTQLPLVFHHLDRSLYPGDLFVASLDQYVSFFWSGAAALSRILPTQIILIASHLISRFALIAAVFDLAGRWFPSTTVRYVALAVLSLRLRGVLAGEVVYAALPTHTTFAFPFIVWGLFLGWRGRTCLAALLLGLACNLNLMTALPAVFVAACGIAALRSRPTVRRMMASGAIWLAAAAPALIWAAQSPAPADASAYQRLIRDLFWWHFDPLAWEPGTYAQWVGLVLLIGIGFAGKPKTAFDRPLIASLGAIAFTWFLAIAVSRWQFLAPLLRLQLGRTATLAVVIAVPLAAAAALRAWHGRGPRDAAVLILLFVGIGLAHGRTAAGILLAAGVLYDGLSAGGWIASRTPRGRRIAVCAAAPALLFLFIAAVARHAEPRKWSGTIYRTWADPWREVMDWARTNTPMDAVFIGPVHEIGFRAGARRGLWFGFDYDAMLWRPDLAEEIRRRHNCAAAAGLTADPVRQINWSELRRLADGERIDYAIVPANLIGDLDPEYRNEQWAIVALAP